MEKNTNNYLLFSNMLSMQNREIYDWILQFLNNVIIIKTKILLRSVPQA